SLYRLPDYHGLADALQEAALLHLLEVLGSVALFWHTSGLLEQFALLDDEEGKEQDERLLPIVRMAAYLVTARVDGWRMLCGEISIDSEVLLKELPGYTTVQRGEQAARAVAFTAEEAAVFVQARWGGGTRPVTAKTFLAGLREFVDWRAGWWE